MRFTQKIKPVFEMESCSEDVIRHVEKIIKYGNIYGIPKGKRYRSAFTTEQINYLEKEFNITPYIECTRRKEVASFLNIPERAVKIWFQNRRMKRKKDDISNKESDKSTEISDVCDNLISVKSIDSSSLPLLKASTSLAKVKTKLDTVQETKHGPKSIFDDPPTSSTDMSVVGTSNSTVTTTTAEVLPLDLPKSYKAGNSNLSSKMQQVRQTPPLIKMQYSGENQNLEKFQHALPSFTHRNLSTRSVAQLQKLTFQENINDAKVSTSELPFYMKGYYTPPYLPPGNIVWKPVSMAPMMASATIPTISNPGSTMPNPCGMWKADCSCNCHKPYAAPVLLQNNSSPNPNMQYVLATVPFPYSSPKV